MRRIARIAFAALAITALCDCNDIREYAESVSEVGTHLVFTATNEVVFPDTKTQRMEDGATWWKTSEEISVFYGSDSNGGSKFTSLNTTLQQTVEFDGSIQMSGSGKEFWAVYPYSQNNECDGSSITTIIPSAQTASEGNFSEDAFPTVAKSKTLDLAFWNICSGIKFSVTRNDIQSVSIKGNNGEMLAGKVKVGFNASGVPEVTEIMDGKSEVTLTAPEGGTFKVGKYYYITLLPTALNSGFTMEFVTATKTGSIVTNKSQFLKRSVFGILREIDSKVEEWAELYHARNIGDIVDANGVGVVVYVEDERVLLMSVEELKNKNWNDSYEWSLSYGYGWRMPTIDELSIIHSNFTAINQALSSNGYTTLTTGNYCHWSSTQNPKNSNYYYRERLHDGLICTGTGNDEYKDSKANYTRAVKELKIDGLTIHVESVILSADAAELCIGETLHLTATILPEDATDKTLTWSSDRPEVATVDENGNVVALTVGTATITVTTADGAKTATCGVTVDVVHPESISLNKTNLSLPVGYSEQLIATVLPENAADKSVVWSSNNMIIASVDEDGNVAALREGTTSIIATTTDGSMTATCTVTVVEQPKLEAVDLGVPSGLKWASWNVGAKTPEDYGDYFAWGEIEPKSKYDWSTYKYELGNDYVGPFSKYVINSRYGTVDNKNVLDSEDDAARANWGSNWCMPTYAEWKELRDNCIWTWTTQYGVKGQLVTGPNGNSIFLPAAGYLYSTSLSEVGSSGYYWSSSLYAGYQSWCYAFGANSKGMSYKGRSIGFSIRAVYSDRTFPVHPESVTLNKAMISLFAGQTEQLTAIILPENAADKTVTWSSDRKEVATVDNNGIVTAIAAGTAVITIQTTDGNLSASCQVVVQANTVETVSGTGSQNYNYLGSANTYSAVLKGSATVGDGFDLDMYFYYSENYNTLDALRMSGTKVFASASQPIFQATVNNLKENTTYYFVACVELKKKGTTYDKIFGEVKSFTTPEYYLPPYVDFGLPSGVKWGVMNLGATNPTESGRSVSWGVGNGNGNSNYQTGAILPLEEDKAHLSLGGYWRTPTREEWVELFECCSCSYSRYHEGGTGLVVSKNGAKIFIPLNDYWTATCCTPYWSGSSGGYLVATAYALSGNSEHFKTYIEKKILNTNTAITSSGKIRPVYVDR